ncbi:MAG: hypothetical protein ACRDKF_12635 [Actinomycetota bacterium]
MTNQIDETRFPAVDRLRETLRADLMRAARTNPSVRSRFFRRRRVIAVVVVLLALIPAALAGAGVFDSHPDVEYECSEAEKQHDDSKVVVGAPVEGPDAPDSVEQEKPSQPEDPCD